MASESEKRNGRVFSNAKKCFFFLLLFLFSRVQSLSSNICLLQHRRQRQRSSEKGDFLALFYNPQRVKNPPPFVHAWGIYSSMQRKGKKGSLTIKASLLSTLQKGGGKGGRMVQGIREMTSARIFLSLFLISPRKGTVVVSLHGLISRTWCFENKSRNGRVSHEDSLLWRGSN